MRAFFLVHSLCSLKLVLAIVVAGVSSSAWGSDEPLHRRIDRLLADKMGGTAAERADDATFLRRVYLDFAGRIPTHEEAERFLASTAPDRRERLLAERLTAPEFPRRMADAFHVMLMERQGDHDEWLKYLQASFAADKPWDQLAREILSPNADDPATRHSAFFLTKRLENYGQNPVDYPGLVRDVGRMFLGIDIQCAECHDHLFVTDYKQADFQGLFAFLRPTAIRRDVDFPAVVEQPIEKKVQFASVFDQVQHETGPRVPGRTEVMLPVFKKGEEFEIAPDRKKNFPGVPKFRQLRILSQEVSSRENRAFARNFANRVWWLMMGRGLVYPLDLHHSANPPSHPELLELLTTEVLAHQFDLRWLLRELALTDAYQRSSRLPPGVDDVRPESYRVALERLLSPEQLQACVLQATGETARVTGDAKELKQARERFAKALANPPKDPELEYSPSVKAALFISNDEMIQQWLAPRPGNLVDQLLKEVDERRLADRLFLSVLTRLPVDEERDALQAHLARYRDRREVGVSHAVWALLASTEFSLNH